MKILLMALAAMFVQVICLTGNAIPADKHGRKSDSPQTRPTVGPATQPAAPLFVGSGPDEWNSYQEMHAYILDRFIRSDGFGVTRMLLIQDAARNRKIYADATRYSVGRVQLISLNGGDEPFEYFMPFDASKDKLKHAKHRALDQFEADALKELLEGKEVVLAGNGTDRSLIGAVRATSSCVKCHEVKEGTLLGAFRYPLIEVTPRQK